MRFKIPRQHRSATNLLLGTDTKFFTARFYNVDKLRHNSSRCFASLLLLYLLSLLAACNSKTQKGELLVSAAGPGKYEIYRIARSLPLQFVAEQVGEFNKDLSLDEGTYLVLADCSHKTVLIKSGSRTQLVTDRILLIPPNTPRPGDHFSIQCSRNEETRSRQNLVNRFELNVLKGKRDILVGLVPLKIESSTENLLPEEHVFHLGALQVTRVNPKLETTPYFISPLDEILSSTASQDFGKWEYLLPGKYRIEVNGTSSNIELGAGQLVSVTPSFLYITAPENTDLNLTTQIRGSPHFVTVNEDHIFYFHEAYPILPGKLKLNIEGASNSLELEAIGGQTHTVQVRSVLVHKDCSPWDWTCLGSLDVQIKQADDPGPFLQGVTDVPLLFVGDDVKLSVQSTREITLRIPNNKSESFYSIGNLKLVPQPTQKSGLLTDLVRVDPLSPGFEGHSGDIPLDEPTTLSLIEGTYSLSEFTTVAGNDGERTRATREFTVKPGETTEISFPSYLSDRKYQIYQKKISRIKKNRNNVGQTPRRYL